MRGDVDELAIGMHSCETLLCVTAGRVCERELGKVWQPILANNTLPAHENLRGSQYFN